MRARTPRPRAAPWGTALGGRAGRTLGCLAVTLLALIVWFYMMWPPKPTIWRQLRVANKKPFRCVAWRQTAGCDPRGSRLSVGDKSCWDSIGPESSGFCECEERMVASSVTCHHPTLTCAEGCALLALSRPEAIPRLPDELQCDQPSDAPPPLGRPDLPPGTYPTHSRQRDVISKGQALWGAIEDAFRAAGGADVVAPPPEKRCAAQRGGGARDGGLLEALHPNLARLLPAIIVPLTIRLLSRAPIFRPARGPPDLARTWPPRSWPRRGRSVKLSWSELPPTRSVYSMAAGLSSTVR